MLLGSFYKITHTEKTDNGFHVKLEMNPAHEIFKGHFPHLPVVPGVCQTQMLLETLPVLLESQVQLSLAHHIKFLALLNPEKNPHLDMQISIDKQEGSKISVSASLESPEEMYFRFKGEFVND